MWRTKPKHSQRPRLSACLALLAQSLVCAGCASGGAANSDDVIVGLLLPFTGASSANASNYERAVLYARDRINESGGIHGHQLRIVAYDTHSELTRSRAAVDALIEAGARVVLGPESSEIAAVIAPLLAAQKIVLLSPLVGADSDSDVDCTQSWFRLAPSAHALGEALAKLMSAQGIQRAAVLSVTTGYDDAFSDSTIDRFSTLQGEIVLEEELQPDAPSYAASVTRAATAEVDAIVLAASPRAGALIVNESHTLDAGTARWFLSPLLKTETFTRNAHPKELEGAMGVAPRIFDHSDEFPRAFSERWQGDQPLEGAYFYYDAMGLLALALEISQLDAVGDTQYDALQEAIIDAAEPDGEVVNWNEIGHGLSQLRAGRNVYYTGLTGPMLLDDCGKRMLGVTANWTVHDGLIAAIQ
jgi:ABC-type branched-subunit amino acid transport system substrate-binding protein